ncbi:MAG: hypothetical protein ACPHV4_01690 [Porticoccaceae bacterium]
MKKLKFTSAAVFIFCSFQSAVGFSDSATSVSEMLTEGDTSINFRYRFELVDQADIDESANASTLKSRLTYKTGTYNGLTGLVEVDNVTVVGAEQYKTPTNGVSGYPIVADPDGTDLNQLSLAYKADDLTATFGRQRILHGGQRFVGGVGFRQNEQTYDALTLSSKSVGSWAVNYSYIWDVNRIFGPKDSAVQAKVWESDSHIILGSTSLAEGHGLKAYAYLLDFENAAANSSRTLGLEYSGKFDGFSVKAAYASQSDYADNPTSYDADYLMTEITWPLKPAKLSLGYEVLGSDNGVGFKTPLATLHKFQGWADKFLITPVNGVEDTYVKLAGKIGPAKVAVFYHEFSADVDGADLGSEFDLVATYPIKKGLSAQLKYADYNADSPSSDTEKVWFTINAKY